MNPTQDQSPIMPAIPDPKAPAPAPSKGKKGWTMLIAVLVIAVAAIAGALWLYNQNQADMAAQQEEGPAVTITATGFSPAVIKIKAGQEVTWTNTDSSSHKLKADTTALTDFDSQDDLNKDDTYTYTFSNTGTFHYYDTANPSVLNGTVIVE